MSDYCRETSRAAFDRGVGRVMADHGLTRWQVSEACGKAPQYISASLRRRKTFYLPMLAVNEGFPGTFGGDVLAREQRELRRLTADAAQKGGLAGRKNYQVAPEPSLCHREIHYPALHPQPKDYRRFGA